MAQFYLAAYAPRGGGDNVRKFCAKINRPCIKYVFWRDHLTT
jgi:hypothetical protein